VVRLYHPFAGGFKSIAARSSSKLICGGVSLQRKDTFSDKSDIDESENHTHSSHLGQQIRSTFQLVRRKIKERRQRIAIGQSCSLVSQLVKEGMRTSL
jgi:hypothetical protein